MATKPQLADDSSPEGKRTAFPPKGGLALSQGPTRVPAEDVAPALIEHALAHSRSWTLAGHGSRWAPLLRRFRAARTTLERIYRPERIRDEISAGARSELLPSRLLHGAILEVEDSLRRENYAPQVEDSGEKVPRAYLAARSYLAAAVAQFNDFSFLSYMQAIQQVYVFEISEIWLLSPLLQLQLLLELSAEIEKAPSELTAEIRERLSRLCTSLTRVRRTDWLPLFETISVTEKILAKDPAGAYSAMEFQSRDRYRRAIQELARYSNSSEEEIASLAVRRAQEALSQFPNRSRASIRFTHVGYYLVSTGRQILEEELGYRPRGAALVRKVLLEEPELYYSLGLEFSIFAILLFLLSGMKGGFPFIAAILLLLLPCSEAAIEAINQLARFILPPRTPPRLDFRNGIPEECSTVVAVPALLVSQDQVEHLVRALEIRYLGNVDKNLYFALLTDPPDSTTAFDEKDELATLCSSLIETLNKRYAQDGSDRFFHLHRNRTFNVRENTWMGWERKRGKLLDFNELIRGGEDKFPVKAGNVTQLRAVRYVITLDADTQLPRGAAARLVGAMAHPLNQAVIDPATRTVKAGYGVLQPRIGISVQSVNRSRLAYIYSGQTGLDIYTHAVSDVYQDMFGEGIFTGKGIYEAEVFHQVLKDRFPSNAILSHDLIEGVYTRTGLVSEIELIDDYPSHFSAYSRRKHRWVRGDWQILKWLFPRVPDANGDHVANPLSLLSRWKILDNLRRSVTEAATFILFLGCWFYMPGSPALWTAAAFALLLIPSYVQAVLAMIRQRNSPHKRGVYAQLLSDFATTQVNVLVFLAFLPHQALVTLDAIARAVIRLTVTHKKLLEWETAAQTEMDNRRTAVDVYLRLTPLITIAIAIGLAVYRPDALRVAAPILLLWLLSEPAAKWLDRPLRSTQSLLSPDDEAYLRRTALKTWRFFRQFSNGEENWLIPDNIQGKDNRAAHVLSTTNLGMLFNSQLAACFLAIETVPKFVALAESTMATVKRLPRFHGHLANWYDSRTLKPTAPVFISSVDNGNLVCCLWTLKQGAFALMEHPLFQPRLFQSIVDHLDIVLEAMKEAGDPRDKISGVESVRAAARRLGGNPLVWCAAIPKLRAELTSTGRELPPESDACWWLEETQRKLQDILEMARAFAPWILPEFAALQCTLPRLFAPEFLSRISINSLSAAYEEIVHAHGLPEVRELQDGVACCIRELGALRSRLAGLAADADGLVDDMDFGLFYDKNQKAISIGFDVTEAKLHGSCYDLLASEARSALFVGIAKNDLPQEAWFLLGRTHTHYANRDVLVSWSGTTFEYLMPALWLKHFPNTLLENSLQGAIDCQRAFVASRRIPWGISEGACPPQQKDAPYDYQAFGLPPLALNPKVSNRLVITPYAAALALNIQPLTALENLRDMSNRGWMGSFGFYESVECCGTPAESKQSFEIVHSSMAHHQGMILVSIGNLLMNSLFQTLFHREVRVEAAARLLHERPLSPYTRELVRETPTAS
jgi:cyclic beta-1,2-glucan synthetase